MIETRPRDFEIGDTGRLFDKSYFLNNQVYEFIILRKEVAKSINRANNNIDYRRFRVLLLEKKLQREPYGWVEPWGGFKLKPSKQ